MQHTKGLAMKALTLLQLRELLANATDPADLFGALAGPADAQRRGLVTAFHLLAQIAHPDRNLGEPDLAQSLFRDLVHWRRIAEERIAAGTYGERTVRIETARDQYELIPQPPGPAFGADFCTLHPCRARTHPRSHLWLKIVRDPRDNDLLAQEALLLTQLPPDPPAASYFPRLIETFFVADGVTRRRANILALSHAAVPLTALRAAYPAGLDPRDAAWIFNRLLEGLYFAHRAGLVNGAILPANLAIDLPGHGVTIMEWAFAAQNHVPLAALCPGYEAWYPPEALAKEPATAATDLYLAARTCLDLVGGDPFRMPADLPAAIRHFLEACLLPSPHRRPSDAGELREAFGEILSRLYGPPRFRPLIIPSPCTTSPSVGAA
jgi:hypothetical protein